MPVAIVQIALILIIVRSVYMTFLVSQRPKKPWLDLLHYVSVAVVAMSFLLH
ncbi:hypothetical protein O9H85_10195 [Paenibacillus filicis]|uniref:Uncharacterized protein n=1 Tax=Paenibacillus gyeongsangnamensis TaxID=3388067 RepID=A0ABT4Q7C8_9BACL|nr:hypothetical protein [Paenibacillus filicis]MCZ8512778.1 hypothetical protein [Paenibacillus filicis]